MLLLSASGSALKLFLKTHFVQGDAPQKEAADGGNIIGRKSAQKDTADLAAQKKERMKAKRKRSKQEDAPTLKSTNLKL